MDIENILITDYHSASNRGDAAILEGEIQAFREVFGEVNITAMTEYPDAADLLHEIEVVPQRMTPFEICDIKKNLGITFSLLDAKLSKSYGLKLPGRSIVHDGLALDPYYDADVVISTGGQFITDTYFPRKLAVLAEWYLVTEIGKPLIIYAQSLGPFSPPYQSIIRNSLNRANIIITRDKQSKQNLDDLGVTTPTQVGVDAAWALPRDTEPKYLQRLNGDLIELSDWDVGPIVSISTRYWSNFDTKKGEERYQRAVAETIQKLIEDHNAKIVFLSTCTGLGGYHTDDRCTAAQIIDMLDKECEENVHLVFDEMTPQQLASAYSEVNVHIGTRMHSCLLALLAETPVVAIEYQFKTTGMMSQLDLEDYVLDIENISGKLLYERVTSVMRNEPDLKEQISQYLPKLQKKAYENARIVRESL
jgi:colanic acid/amylovoran biosynthesis protein